MPVQAVYKFTEHGDDRRIFAGRVEAGKVAVGDKVVFSPSNKIYDHQEHRGLQRRAAQPASTRAGRPGSR